MAGSSTAAHRTTARRAKRGRYSSLRNFAAAMSTREVAENSLEDTLYGVDIGGDAWLDERHPGQVDWNGVWQDGNLVRPNGANVAQARAHTRRASTCSGIFTGTSQT